MTSDNGLGFYWVRVAVPVEVLDEIYRQGGPNQGALTGTTARYARPNGESAPPTGATGTGMQSGQAGYTGSGGQSSRAYGPQTARGAYAPPTQQWEARQIHHMTAGQLERYVNLALDQNHRTTNADINATVNNGTVILSGRTRSKQAKREAERIAWSIPDVQDVENNIQVLGRTATT